MSHDPQEETLEAFERRLRGASAMDEPPADLEARIVARSRMAAAAIPSPLKARPIAPVIPISIALAAAAAMAVWVSNDRKHPIRPDPSPPPAASPTASAPRRVPEPVCSKSAGLDVLLDDFEDGDPLIHLAESRDAVWTQYTDRTAGWTVPILKPSPHPAATPTNHLALHASDTQELLEWGATLQLAFRPTCVDLSRFEGMRFSAKGPGRFYLGVRETRVVPTAFGGTCESDCYDTHQKKIDMGKEFQTFEVKFSDLHQRKYGSPALDLTKVHSIVFSVQPGDTPFDYWLDDVRFVPVAKN